MILSANPSTLIKPTIDPTDRPIVALDFLVAVVVTPPVLPVAVPVPLPLLPVAVAGDVAPVVCVTT